MLLNIIITLLLSNFEVKCQILPTVNKGSNTSIEQHAHSAFLYIHANTSAFVCGASILNQRILLTAAHCLQNCKGISCTIEAFVGDSNKKSGTKYKIIHYITHRKYERRTVANNIAVALSPQDIQLGQKIQRVALMRYNNETQLVSNDTAMVAGWGYVDEYSHATSKWLHYTEQTVWTLEKCREMLYSVPNGCICGGDMESDVFVSKGDSGSALVVDGYIQIGIVSFKRPDYSRSLAVYTNVTYFYKWIVRGTRKLMERICDIDPT